jgi:phospholipid N-methyltransferase
MHYTATYSPDDNKLRLTASARLDAETYARVKAAGFKWAPRLDQFIAPMWTPERADLCIELAGEIDDEDTTLMDRAEVRADRFDEYHEKREADARRASAAADEYAKPFANGQPILVGHHSEKRARKDQERCHNAMRRAVNAWDTAAYWTDRAAAAIAHAKYKERPDVRARRIKKLEAELRKMKKIRAGSQDGLTAWTAADLTLEHARILAGVHRMQVCRKEGSAFGWSAYDVLQPDGERYSLCPAWTLEQVIDVARRVFPKSIAKYDRWIEHYEMRLAYERAMLGETGYIEPPKRVGKAVLPLLNYAGETLVKGMYGKPPNIIKLYPITKAEFAKIRGDNKGTRIAADGTHRVRVVSAGYVPGAKTDGHVSYSLVGVYLTDAKQHTKPGTTALETRDAQEVQARIERAQAKLETNVAARNRARAHNAALVEKTPTVRKEAPAEVKELRQALAAGPAKVVAVPNLFPTPPDLARRMVELAEIEPGMCVLEPSAGSGNIVQAVVDAVDTEILAYEINPDLVAHLSRTFPSYRLQARRADFLEVTDFLGCYPRVLMNPPFDNGADIKHIMHAAKFLKPGGRLVAICANGPRQQAQLKPWAEEHGGMYEPLPAGTFADAGTNVNTALVAVTL